MTPEWLLNMSIKVLYLPKTNFWLRPWKQNKSRPVSGLTYIYVGYRRLCNLYSVLVSALTMLFSVSTYSK